MAARIRLPQPLSGLLRSELEHAIYEAALSRDESVIATRYIVEKVPQIDIAAELGWERSTVSRHMPYIVATVSAAAKRLYP